MTDGTTSTTQVTIDSTLVGGDGFADLAADVGHGLALELKELPPKYFYDERGSRLFEAITELPEYYPTRTERRILDERAGEIIEAAGVSELVELGSGSALKTRTLLDAMDEAGRLERYVPVDISADITRETAAALALEYPALQVHGVICDFVADLERVLDGGDGRLIAFLGSTIGNFRDGEAGDLLSRIAAGMGPGDRLLLGTDLVKDTPTLEAAYNDAAGVTSEFNKNVLHVLNRELGADFDPDGFQHVAFYDRGASRMDIRLRSLRSQRVTLRKIDLEADFAEGEEMRTELSHKFTREGIERLYERSDLRLEGWFTDPREMFALSLASRA
jgi:L-histidine Nalpha-methyltransferase